MAEETMPEDRVTVGTIQRRWDEAGADRIDVTEQHALKHWSAKLGVTHWEVKAAVRKVGPLAKDVARALGSNARI